MLAKIQKKDLAPPTDPLSKTQRHVLLNLKSKGFFIAQPEDFSLEFQMLQREAMREALFLIENGLNTKTGTKKYLLNLDLAKAPTESVKKLYNFFKSPEIVKLASKYLGEKALMVELKVLLSPPVQMPDKDGSQLWHSDFDDVSDLKFFIFLEEVALDSGPLEVVEKSTSQNLMQKWGYQWGVPKISHNDAIVPKEYSNQIVSMVGKAGTIGMVDAVQCLHRGSRNPQRTRKILYATFNTRTSFRYPPINWIFGETLTKNIRHVFSPLLAIDPNRHFIDSVALNSQ